MQTIHCYSYFDEKSVTSESIDEIAGRFTFAVRVPR